ncbi:MULTISPECIES: hypothetical protein [unclassified Streptomyces]|uniref:hypothetical protein n=1 Tax=unclassified Streptomyces TaxID=2593676 RepID=UPI0021562DE8|nr:hypothetical protein [Streptomyces sp. SM10]
MTDNGDGRPSAGELGELDELRRRLSALEKGGPSASHHRFRSFGSVLLTLLAALLSMLSVVAVRADSIVGDIDRYVATVGRWPVIRMCRRRSPTGSPPPCWRRSMWKPWSRS